jgi:hypothetical protein
VFKLNVIDGSVSIGNRIMAEKIKLIFVSLNIEMRMREYSSDFSVMLNDLIVEHIK